MELSSRSNGSPFAMELLWTSTVALPCDMRSFALIHLLLLSGSAHNNASDSNVLVDNERANHPGLGRWQIDPWAAPQTKHSMIMIRPCDNSGGGKDAAIRHSSKKIQKKKKAS